MDISKNKFYYQTAHEALAGAENHPGFNYLKSICKEEKGLIVDIGCGEGSRLDYLVGGNNGVGIDINHYAIDTAQKKYSRFKFYQQKDNTIPLPDNSAATAYSTFVLEHTEDAQLFLKEMIRIVKPGGKLVIICPNYGAPNRRSPNSIRSPLAKLFEGLTEDILRRGTVSNWDKVVPKAIFNNIDDDTTIEPYHRTLEAFFRDQGLSITKSSSLWRLEPFSFNLRKLLFRLLGQCKTYPYNYWGPQVFVVVIK